MDMITPDKLDEEYKRQHTRNTIFNTGAAVITGVCVGLSVLSFYIDAFSFKHSMFFLIAGFVIICVMIKLSIPKSANMALNSLSAEFMRDYNSDHIYAKAYSLINDQKDPLVRQRTICVAAEIASIRGDIAGALGLMQTVDTNVIARDDEMSAIYWHDMLFYYFQAEDMDSVQRLYADIAPIFDRYAAAAHPRWDVLAMVNFYVSYAKGDYAGALEQRLALNVFKEKILAMNKRPQPVHAFMRGQIYFETAYAYFGAGDMQSAGRCLDMAAPCFSRDPYWIDRCNKLAARIQGTQDVH